jgi:Transglutaminase-like superfamily
MRRMPPDRPLAPLERARLGLEIVAAYARASLELRRVPIEEVMARLRAAGSQPDPAHDAAELEEARRLGGAVVRTLRFLPGDTRCLRRSLVTVRLLARRGIAAQLVIGARTAPDFLAHAWVEHDGVPVLSAGGGSFGRLVEL